jgi:hypothetical protein
MIRCERYPSVVDITSTVCGMLGIDLVKIASRRRCSSLFHADTGFAAPRSRSVVIAAAHIDAKYSDRGNLFENPTVIRKLREAYESQCDLRHTSPSFALPTLPAEAEVKGAVAAVHLQQKHLNQRPHEARPRKACAQRFRCERSMSFKVSLTDNRF